MYVVEIFLPLRRPGGQSFPARLFDDLKNELTDRFGGVTAFSRSPAEGLWKADSARVVRDEIAIFEVQTENLDRGWWQAFRKRLERDFEQDEVLIRAVATIEL